MHLQTNNFDKKVSSLGYIYTLASTAAMKTLAISHLLPYPWNRPLEVEDSGYVLFRTPLPSKQGSVTPSSARDIWVEVGWELLLYGDWNQDFCVLGEFLRTTPWLIIEPKLQFCQKFSTSHRVSPVVNCFPHKHGDLNLVPSTHGEKPSMVVCVYGSWGSRHRQIPELSSNQPSHLV